MASDTGDDGRSVASVVFQNAAVTAVMIASMVPEPARTALLVAAELSRVVSALVSSIGVGDTQELIAELKRDKGLGRIREQDVAADNKKIRDAVADLFADG